MSDISQSSIDTLEAEKIAARQHLLKLSPAEAQNQVNQTLHAELWRVQIDGCSIDRSTNFPLASCVMSPLTPDALKTVLQQLQQAEINLVIVGGQAINLWAMQYYQPTSEWDELQPFASMDLDLFGGRLEAVQCSEVLSGTLTLAKNFDPSPNAGVVMLNWQDRPFRINVLSSVYGLNDTEIVNTALPFLGTDALSGVQLKVLHPLLCLESKLKCLRGLDQTARQDEKHVRLAVLILRAFLTSQLASQPTRSLLNAIERIADNIWTDAGLNAWYQYGIEIESAIPIEEIQPQQTPQWQAFTSIRWAQITDRATTKRSQYEQLMRRYEQ
ncbi:hypothetical protein ACQ4M3_33245 [Leptolyngbya sp. AN03gr2]|uniref:hypothetical protein n=1 Tax=unclassified Leptolyngbya TaxID=2650499 RepID=UPI003D322EA9